MQLHGVMLRRSKTTCSRCRRNCGRGCRSTCRRAPARVPSKRSSSFSPERTPGPRHRGTSSFDAAASCSPSWSRHVQALAFAKAAATLDFVRGAIDQGEKVIVFSCFDDPIQKLATALGETAVVVTGKTPAAMRQPLVDRFQTDVNVRVFVANIIAGGTGLNLTAATQVVFNDLDWVPTNHWQAEDRAYRIGQTRTVNVTYFVARDTIDDFVQAVLETKAALVNAIVEGDALAPGSGGDVVDELQRVLHAISAGDGVAAGPADAMRGSSPAAPRVRGVPDDAPPPRTVRQPYAVNGRSRPSRALEALVKVLSGPSARRFRISSTSHTGVDYEIVVADADVTCSCPGFEYRGQCRHAGTSRPHWPRANPAGAVYGGAHDVVLSRLSTQHCVDFLHDDPEAPLAGRPPARHP